MDQNQTDNLYMLRAANEKYFTEAYVVIAKSITLAENRFLSYINESSDWKISSSKQIELKENESLEKKLEQLTCFHTIIRDFDK